MTTGTVKWFNIQKGFGFIAPADGGNDAFVHISAVERSGLGDLREGQKGSFELVSDGKSGKMSADNLKELGCLLSAALDFRSVPTSCIASFKPTTDVLAA